MSVRKPCSLRGMQSEEKAQEEMIRSSSGLLTAITRLYRQKLLVLNLPQCIKPCASFTSESSDLLSASSLFPSPSGLSCSSAPTELTGGLTVEFYHHPFSPFSHSLSLFLSLLATSLAYSALLYLIGEMFTQKRFFGRQVVCVKVVYLPESVCHWGFIFTKVLCLHPGKK